MNTLLATAAVLGGYTLFKRRGAPRASRNLRTAAPGRRVRNCGNCPYCGKR